eukprot:100118-Prorocentrum_minimum.AAC.1
MARQGPTLGVLAAGVVLWGRPRPLEGIVGELERGVWKVVSGVSQIIRRSPMTTSSLLVLALELTLSYERSTGHGNEADSPPEGKTSEGIMNELVDLGQSMSKSIRSRSRECRLMGRASRKSLSTNSFADSCTSPLDVRCRFTSSPRWLSTHTFPSSNTCVFLHTGQSNCMDFLTTVSIIMSSGMSSGGGGLLELTAANVAMQEKQNRWVHESATGFLQRYTRTTSSELRNRGWMLRDTIMLYFPIRSKNAMNLIYARWKVSRQNARALHDLANFIRRLGERTRCT